MKRRRFLVCFGGGMTAIISGCTFGGRKDSLDIVEHRSELLDEDTFIVIGVAENTTTDELNHAEVRAKFLDSEGRVIDSGQDSIDGLGALEEWKFEIIALGTDPDRIDGYSTEIGNVW